MSWWLLAEAASAPAWPSLQGGLQLSLGCRWSCTSGPLIGSETPLLPGWASGKVSRCKHRSELGVVWSYRCATWERSSGGQGSRLHGVCPLCRSEPVDHCGQRCQIAHLGHLPGRVSSDPWIRPSPQGLSPSWHPGCGLVSLQNISVLYGAALQFFEN